MDSTFFAPRRRLAGRLGLAAAVTLLFSGWLAPPASAAVITVTTTVDEFADPGPDTGCSLREAIEAANTDTDFGGCDDDTGDDVISLGAAAYQLTRTDNPNRGDLEVTADLAITGAGANVTTIQQTLTGPGMGGVVKITSGELALTGLTITGGVEKEGVKAEGGASLVLDAVAISGNTGGGVKVDAGGDLTATHSTFSGNGDPEDPKVGGASAEDADIANSTFSGNFAKQGGGLSVSGAATLNNVTMTANTVEGAGGSAKGGGLHVDGATGTASISNTVIAGNTNAGENDAGPDDCSADAGDITSGGYNFIGTGDGCNWPDPAGTGDQVGTDAAPLDPQLEPLANTGGTTSTHRPASGSPLVDAGNPATPDGTPPNCETDDQRGVTRPQGTACDIGAVERGPGDDAAAGGGGDEVGGVLASRCRGVTASILGTGSKDRLRGTSGKDVIVGLAGRDRIAGKAKRDRLCGVGGKDKLNGGGGKDFLIGGKGNDVLRGGPGRDVCVGGKGRDRAVGCEKTRKVP